MTTPAPSLQQWPLAVFVRESPWAYPTLEVVHLMGLGLLFGTLFLVELRLLGRLRIAGVVEFARAALPWTLAGFALSVVSGLLLFASRADEFVSNPMFLAKMGLILAAGINAAVLHASGPLDADRAATRWQAAASLLFWVGVIACGRFIAYV